MRLRTEMFLMPDYYPEFACKGGACRHTCCRDWTVTISMEDYFKLVGLSCPPELRRRLDMALHLCENPTREKYAEIAHDWQGQCPLQDESGLCLLHAQCGEEALSTTCRYHPRSIRTRFDNECACSCSCEAVVEILLAHKGPLRFLRAPQTFAVPEYTGREDLHAKLHAREVRDMMLWLLEDRARPLSHRLARTSVAARLLDEGVAIPEVLTRLPADPGLPQGPVRSEVLREAHRMMRELFDGYEELSPICEQARENVGESAEKWAEGARRFVALVPDAEGFFENVLINHLFYRGYPESEYHFTYLDTQYAVLADYVVLRYTLVGTMFAERSVSRVADVCAACFRVIEHTNFEQRAVSLVKNDGLTAERMKALIAL